VLKSHRFNTAFSF